MNRQQPCTPKALTSILVITVVVGLAANPVSAQFIFDPAVSIPAAERPEGVALGDLDGDGDADLVVTRDTPDRISVYLNDGSGNYGAAADYLTGAGTGPGAVLIGDLNGDEIPDLAVILNGIDTVQAWLNLGAGTFAAGASTGVGADPRGPAMGDFDGDLDLDLATANRNTNDVTILLNDGSGSFAATAVAVGEEPRAVAAGDFDGDTDLDLAVTNHRDRDISILINAAGVFASMSRVSVGGELRPDGVAAGDLDGDMDTDIAVATSGTGLNFVSVFLNDGAGTFAGPVNYTTGGINPGSVAIADLDCDTDPDLIVSNQDSNDVSLLANGGAAVFGPPALLVAGTRPGTLAIADLDGDLDSEVVVANRDSNDVSTFTNQTCLAPGDMNCDGIVNSYDIDGFICAVSPACDYEGLYPDCDRMLADTNGDGAVDAYDIDSFIALVGGG